MDFGIEYVGKIGSMALINREDNEIDYNIFARISAELKPGWVWVSSGATEIGRLDYIKRSGAEIDEPSDELKTDYAAQGQTVLMQTYRQYISPKYSVRQLLVEHQHFNDESKRKHIKDFLLRCPAQNAVPIVNYNDAVSFEENRKMEILSLSAPGKKILELVDNDETAAQISCLLRSKYLLILTSVDGIYKNPADPASRVETVTGSGREELLHNITVLQESCVGSSRRGAAGARAKLEHIKEPAVNGAAVFIANSKYRISDILSGRAPSTRIGLGL
jgi:glutamate 5-kinase